VSKLYIIPCPIAEEDPIRTLPVSTIEVIHQLKHFVVERAKTARRFIKLTQPPYAISEINVAEMDKHDQYGIPEEVMTWAGAGENIGLLSEAGCPCVADPGFHVVRIFRERGYRIVPLVGPSSLLLALMASGLNGQAFTFHGYLPIEENNKKQLIRKMETVALKDNYAQMVIETPYRNQKLFSSFCKFLQAETLLHISLDLTGESEYCESKSVKAWIKSGMQFPKSPAIFIIGKK